ncbi:MAG: metallophosphoesterase [Eubacteriaceae bacterium]|nr:metallophosphoesterase [Eubacteriaceae bacterium]
MRYYISDCHFFHGAMNEKMDRRGFSDTEEMNRVMIERWNSRVRKNDEVVILGDLSWGGATETALLLRELKGKKFLLEGNHDRFLSTSTFDRDLYFGWIAPYREMNDDGRKVILCHYPVFCYNGQYRLRENGDAKTYMLYGHVHNTMDERLVNSFISRTRLTEVEDYSGQSRAIPCNMINCFCMFSDYVPLTLDEWIENDRIRRKKLTGEEEKGNE